MITTTTRTRTAARAAAATATVALSALALSACSFSFGTDDAAPEDGETTTQEQSPSDSGTTTTDDSTTTDAGTDTTEDATADDTGSGAPALAQADVEQQVSDQLAAQVGQTPDDITCPGDLPAEVGATMTCLLTAGTDTIDVYLTVTTVDGMDVGYDIKVADQVN